MRSTLVLPLFVFLGTLTACSTPPAEGPAPSTPSGTGTVDPSPPAAGAPALSADGKHFAADAQFKGTCAPAGSRGGCYALTFHPDGRAEHLLLDATESGTYRIEGKAVIYRSTLPDAQDQRFESPDGFRTLGTEYHYVP